MFGLGDIWVFFAFILSLLSVLACVVYGAINWNRGTELEIQQIDEEIHWQLAENKIEEEF